MKGRWSILRVLQLVALLIAATSIPRATSAQTENQAYLPFDRSDIRPQFQLRALGAYAISSQPRSLPVGVSGINVHSTTAGDTILKGADSAGNPWTVQLGEMGCFGTDASLYMADLDRNGVNDLLAYMPTCGVGLAPSAHIFTLMFDAKGRPMPFEADGYFERVDKGLFDIADLNGDGRADLLYMNFDDGYWITNVYTAQAARWVRVRGKFGRHTYPLVTRFTYTANHRPTMPKAGRHPFAPDLSQAHPSAVGRLDSYTWANVRQSEDIQLNVRVTGNGVGAFAPVSWYASFALVLDGKGGRHIVMLSASEAAIRGALDEIVRGKYRVELYGRRRSEKASPELLWADSKT